MGPGTRRLAASLTVLAGTLGLSSSGFAAPARETRSISFFHIHTEETLTVVYKDGGKYIPEALRKIDWIMRDWRKNESVVIDPAAIDILWEMHTELGSKVPISIICGYRSEATNTMLRRTVGGQASQSQHMTGKAIDVAFPDIPVRQLRYSALVRERGGVGYYPTSGIPFVHVDTGRVRHWPRMGRDELALLFPSGRSKHEPADGRPITPADVRTARTRSPGLVTHVAGYFDLRDRPKDTVLVADAGGWTPVPVPAPRPVQAPQSRMAVGAPPPSSADIQAAVPQLVAAPRLIERPSRFTENQAGSDRSRLDMLVTLASLDESAPASQKASIAATLPEAAAPKPTPQFAQAGASVLGSLARPAKAPAAKPLSKPVEVASLDPQVPAPAPQKLTLARGVDWRAAWTSAPEYDDDHPDELSYRPFPLTAVLTSSASPDDPVLAKIVHPDAARALDYISGESALPPVAFGSGSRLAVAMMSQSFGGATAAKMAGNPAGAAVAGLAERSVRTVPR